MITGILKLDCKLCDVKYYVIMFYQQQLQRINFTKISLFVQLNFRNPISRNSIGRRLSRGNVNLDATKVRRSCPQRLFGLLAQTNGRRQTRSAPAPTALRVLVTSGAAFPLTQPSASAKIDRQSSKIAIPLSVTGAGEVSSLSTNVCLGQRPKHTSSRTLNFSFI